MSYLPTMSLIVPKFDLNESGYSLQLRPMKTTKEDRDAGRQHYAQALWLAGAEGRIYEVCVMSGVVIPLAWKDDNGSRELFERAKRLVLMSQDDWNALNKDERRQLNPQHLRWLSMPQMTQAFIDAIDAEIAKRPETQKS
jgi:hypothetical protein